MSSRDLVGVGSSDGSALGEFLSHATIYEKAGGIMPRGLIVYGFYGAAALVVVGLLALVLPDPTSISRGGFFLLFKGLAAGLDDVMQALAWPAILTGLALIGLDVYLSVTPTSESWRMAIVGETAAGGVGGSLAVLFLVLFIFNLAIWVAIVGACIGLACLLLAAFASA